MKKRYFILYPVLFLFLVLGIIIVRNWIGVTFNLEYSWRYGYDKAPKISSIKLKGDKNSLVLVDVDTDDVKIPANISVSQNYLISVDYKERYDSNSSNDRTDPGESVIVTQYDLNDNLKQTRYDLIPLLEQKGIRGQLNRAYVLTYKGVDYLQFNLRDTDGTKVLWYNIQTGEIEQDDVIGFGAFDRTLPTNLHDVIRDKYAISLYTLSLNQFYYKAKNLDTINISEDSPEIAKALTDGSALYVRSGFISEEEWFNLNLHWFAPKGQDVIEVYEKDYKTGEKMQIKSYADYQAWKAAHPESSK